MTENDRHSLPRWTDDDLRIAWEIGRDFERARIEVAADDLTYTSLKPAITGQQRIAQRAAEYLTCAQQARQKLAEQAARNHAHDQQGIALGLAMPPAYTSWPQVHAAVSESVWWRVWWDLNDAEQAEHAQLAPQAAFLKEAA